MELEDIFLPAKKDNEILSYESTSDYISSDKKIKTIKKPVIERDYSKPILANNNIVKELNQSENKVTENKKVILSKKALILIRKGQLNRN